MPSRQSQAYEQQAPAVAGDFASSNPRGVVLAGPAGLVAGPSGVVVGNWGWTTYLYPDGDNAPAIVNSFGAGLPAGFCGRQGAPALITQYLAEASMTIPQGFAVTLYNYGDFWVKNSGGGQALVGMKAYANYANGTTSFAATGSPTQSATSTSSTIAASTFSVTGAVSGNVLTVSAVGSGTIYPGATISGTGIATGTMVVAQLSGTAGGIGTYALNIAEQSAASTTVSGTYGTLTIGGTVTGTYALGDLITGSGVTAGSYITAFISGAGGAGTYVVTQSQTIGSGQAIDANSNIETPFYCASSGLSGELVKMSALAAYNTSLA